MAKVKIDILGISELKWTGMGEFNSDDHCIYSLLLFLDLHTDFSGGSKVVWYSDLFKNIPQFVMIYTKVLA